MGCAGSKGVEVADKPKAAKDTKDGKGVSLDEAGTGTWVARNLNDGGVSFMLLAAALQALKSAPAKCLDHVEHCKARVAATETALRGDVHEYHRRKLQHNHDLNVKELAGARGVCQSK